MAKVLVPGQKVHGSGLVAGKTIFFDKLWTWNREPWTALAKCFTSLKYYKYPNCAVRGFLNPGFQLRRSLVSIGIENRLSQWGIGSSRSCWGNIISNSASWHAMILGRLSYFAALKNIDYKGWIEVFMHPVPRGIPIMPTAAQVTTQINVARAYLETCLRGPPRKTWGWMSKVPYHHVL